MEDPKPTQEQQPNTEAQQSTNTKPARKPRSKKEKTKTMATATARKPKSRKRNTENSMAILSEKRDQYKVDKGHKTAGGNPTVSCGDGVAKALVGLGPDELAKIAKENDISDRWSGWMKAGLNPGQLRMNLGNVLRGIIRRGESKVTIKGKPVSGSGLKTVK